ncbi:hypothetical protein DOFOFD_10425 [Acetobacteraceae bacterium EV16P]|uniref:Uncharacterized protein n=1 Tax=Sorlinia euscelidii TaxID=3081148 RepID=A0ABU7U3I8_9PROT
MRPQACQKFSADFNLSDVDSIGFFNTPGFIHLHVI